MKTVVSASRRTDMVKYFPEQLLERLEEHPPESVHSIVVWTKDPENILRAGALRDRLVEYAQIFVHFTITGLGGGAIEPNVPAPASAMDMLPGLIGFVGSPGRLRVRFDPIINFSAGGKYITNLDFFPVIAARCAELGIFNMSTSWAELYPKVLRRLARNGLELAAFDFDAQLRFVQQVAAENMITMHYCCVPGMPRSRCIDGELLTRLHPGGERASAARASGQRPLCGCTRSTDIGWYSLKCLGGCVYCYAIP